ncbi:hypothetical protein DY218_12335 [Streptomyces triticagri]|uniref:Uncharacterized protein n=1 Tax=Streptomyces triticagri TaxID=2293568 RepID=A0A372M664_9ACTN|nr:hypothetical protein DY218_12335 [Streptomyces triticagri]
MDGIAGADVSGGLLGRAVGGREGCAGTRSPSAGVVPVRETRPVRRPPSPAVLSRGGTGTWSGIEVAGVPRPAVRAVAEGSGASPAGCATGTPPAGVGAAGPVAGGSAGGAEEGRGGTAARRPCVAYGGAEGRGGAAGTGGAAGGGGVPGGAEGLTDEPVSVPEPEAESVPRSEPGDASEPERSAAPGAGAGGSSGSREDAAGGGGTKGRAGVRRPSVPIRPAPRLSRGCSLTRARRPGPYPMRSHQHAPGCPHPVCVGVTLRAVAGRAGTCEEPRRQT